jgi:hypothetical protein
MEELTPTPSPRVITVDGTLGTNCPTIEFQFTAEDPDLLDTLFVRFYVDYPLFPEKGLSLAAFAPDLPDGIKLLPTGKSIRQPVSFKVNVGNPANRVPLSRLNIPGTHLVEALVYDGTLGLDRLGLPLSQSTDGGPTDNSYVATYPWVVEVVNPCPPP